VQLVLQEQLVQQVEQDQQEQQDLLVRQAQVV
jgi:hypothetical protein